MILMRGIIKSSSLTDPYWDFAMIKRLHITIVIFLFLFFFFQTACINNSFRSEKTKYINQEHNTALAEYFYRIGVLDEKHEDLSLIVDWPWYEELFSLSLPGHEIIDYLKWSVELDPAQVLAQIIYAIDQKEFVHTYDDILPKPVRFLEAGKLMGFHISEISLGTILSVLFKARVDMGYYSPYLGYIKDSNVYRLAREKHRSITKDHFLKEVPELFELGIKLLEKGMITGYNIKDYNENPIFQNTHTIRYDHGDIGHILQMISLLRRERINARIALKSRISSYLHHIDQWGQPDWCNVTAQIDDDLVILSSVSFDILLEFPAKSYQKNFKDIISKYALRREQNTHGLIRASYYTPVYASSVPLPGYKQAIDLRISKDGFYLQSYILADSIKKINKYSADLPHNYRIEYIICYVNPEFKDYLKNITVQSIRGKTLECASSIF